MAWRPILQATWLKWSLARCAFNNYHMGQTAENVAAKFGLNRTLL